MTKSKSTRDATRKPISDARKRNRVRRKQLTEFMDRIAGEAFSAVFDRGIRESVRLNYPVNIGPFIRMYLQAMDKQLVAHEQGSGVSRTRAPL